MLVTALGIMHTLTMTPLYEAGTVIQFTRDATFARESLVEASVMPSACRKT